MRQINKRGKEERIKEKLKGRMIDQCLRRSAEREMEGWRSQEDEGCSIHNRVEREEDRYAATEFELLDNQFSYLHIY